MKVCLKTIKLLIVIILIATCLFVQGTYASVPITLQSFKQYHDSNYYNILEMNKYDSEDIQNIENFLKEAIDKNDFSICTWLTSMNSIIDSNKIMSSTEMSWEYSKDNLYDEINITRKYATPEFFNVDIKFLEGKDYEKYGFLSCKDKKLDYKDQKGMFPGYYGEVVINLKKENLKNRTTLVVGDSLNKRQTLGKNSVIPTLVDDPKIVCIPGYKNSTVKALSKTINDKKILPNRPGLISSLEKELEMFFECFELQFHGDIIFDRDVESVTILKNSREYFDNTEKEKCTVLEKSIQEKLKSMNIPCSIIDCKEEVSSYKLKEEMYPELNQTFQTSDGKIMIKAPKGVFVKGSELCSGILKEGTQAYNEVFSNFDDYQKKLTEKIKIFDLYVLDSTGKKIINFKDYVTLYIQIPDSYDKNDLDMIHINKGEDEEFEEHIESIGGINYLVFKTNHFSPYALIDKISNNNNNIVIVFMGIILIVAGMFLSIYFYKKSKNKAV